MFSQYKGSCELFKCICFLPLDWKEVYKQPLLKHIRNSAFSFSSGNAGTSRVGSVLNLRLQMKVQKCPFFIQFGHFFHLNGCLLFILYQLVALIVIHNSHPRLLFLSKGHIPKLKGRCNFDVVLICTALIIQSQWIKPKTPGQKTP